MAEKVLPKNIEWEFEGAISIVFEHTNTMSQLAKPGLKSEGFSFHSIRHKDDIASCGNVKIKGINSLSHYGILMKDIQNFISYNFIERVVTADGKILWERPRR
jgi:hypothetical protein